MTLPVYIPQTACTIEAANSSQLIKLDSQYDACTMSATRVMSVTEKLCLFPAQNATFDIQNLTIWLVGHWKHFTHEARNQFYSSVTHDVSDAMLARVSYCRTRLKHKLCILCTVHVILPIHTPLISSYGAMLFLVFALVRCYSEGIDWLKRRQEIITHIRSNKNISRKWTVM